MSEDKLDPTEVAIREKIRAGLSRDQAIAVVAAQADHDAALEKAAKAAKAAAKNAATTEK